MKLNFWQILGIILLIAGGAWWAPAGPAATAAPMVARNARRFIRACSIRFESGVEPETDETEATGPEATEATVSHGETE